MPTAYRIEARYTARGQKMVTGFHVRISDASLLTDVGMGALLDAVDTALTTPFRAMLMTSDQLNEWSAKREPDPTDSADIPEGRSKIKNVAGTSSISGNLAPPELCLVCSFKTGVLSRSARGHCFLPPVFAATHVIGDTVDSASASYTTAQAFRDALDTIRAGNGFHVTTPAFDAPLVVYSKTRRRRSEDPWLFDVTSESVRNRTHWLRSRSGQA